jgi:3-methyladenine DNA glycosylase/8-oxoguanine DNA glycosylase
MILKATIFLFAAMILSAAISPDQISAVKEHYLALGSTAIEAKPSAAPDAAKVTRVDASQKIRSASFGHRTTLLVDVAQPTHYWVEYGKSTNTPAAVYGPFDVK